MFHVRSVLLIPLAVLACSNGTDDTDDTDTDDTDVVDTDTNDTDDTDDCEGVVDDCGVCDGNNADKDCAGVCFGDAVVDTCGTCDDDATNDCVASTSTTGAWACSVGTSCQDVYTFDLASGTDVTVALSSVTGDSAARLAVFAPGVGLDGTNLLTNRTYDWRCEGQDEGETATFTAATSGTYTLAVGRDWGSSAGASGTYALDVDADPGLAGFVSTADDATSQATDETCGWTWEVSGAWTCASGESCRDVYDVELPAGVEVDLQVSDVTGSSVVMLAAYRPGVGLDGVNMITGSAQDLACGGQNVSQSWEITTDAAGVWRFAVGRNWGPSAGATGTYRFTIVEQGASSPATQTVNDVDSESTGASCPL